jgi:hypothetical protein
VTNFTIDQDRHQTIKFTYKESSVATSIIGAVLTFAMFSSITGGRVVLKRNIAAGGGSTEINWVTDGSDGEFYVYILPADTKDLPDSRYYWEIKMTLDGKDTTPGEGEIIIDKTRID